MARSVNQVILLGNLTRDPELRQTPSGQSVVSFSLALNRAYKAQNGEWQEATDYIDCVAWGPLAERVSQYLTKGRRALVQGRMQSRSWEQDGQKRSKVEVLASDVTFVDSRGGEGGSEGGAGGYNGDGGGGNAPAPSRNSGGSNSGNGGSASSSKKKDEVVEDIGDEPINLDDIPF
ncbi:MAG TPA: single-stranded DNA-binding protein [Candidatus Saccharimonadales bacterium]|nr:single-stranded DNA-binding protein [Candidatus Saccharimonadales bacterium]